MSVDLIISNHTRTAINTRWLARHLHKLLKLQKVAAGDWSITIIPDRAMAALHQRTMNDPTPTDVLTFDLRDKTKNQKSKIKTPLDLDTVLGLGVAKKNAKRHHHSLDHELLLYSLHSLLHVQGYDDLTLADHARMHRREDTLLIALGLGPLFHGATIALRGNARPNRSSRSNRNSKIETRK